MQFTYLTYLHGDNDGGDLKYYRRRSGGIKKWVLRVPTDPHQVWHKWIDGVVSWVAVAATAAADEWVILSHYMQKALFI